MFYVLNFNDHSFTSFNFPEQVSRQLDSLLTQGVDSDVIEIVCADEDSRMTEKEFLEKWS